jgi:hypothetical protein
MGAVALTVKNCRFENVGFGVTTEFAGSSDFYIADNLFLGRDDRFRLIGWGGRQRHPGGNVWAEPLYGSHRLTSYYAVKVYGQGHVIAHNSIAYFHDAIYNNDMHLMNDDFIETDGGVHNIRVFNNRGVNAAQGGFSSQPVFGGPAYFIRNLLYNVPSGTAFKFSAKPAGLFVYHNTIIGEALMGDPSANMHFRNNLLIGRDTPGRGVFRVANSTSENTSDFNGYRPNKDVTAQYSYFAPKKGERVYEAKSDQWQTFPTLAAMAKATGQDSHSIEVGLDIFENMTPPDPAQKYTVYHAMDLNFRLKSGANAVDAGVTIPTVNEDHTGRAPDLGALEVGKPMPHYGPRWLTWQPFYR